jgi:hypothetical protein
MKRTDVSYGQLDKVLRSLGFTCRVVQQNGEGRRYEHRQSGAVILLPAFPADDKVWEHHLVGAQVTLENFGIADASVFAAKLQKAG